jgi:putative ABC transport system substrate-binding protein
MDKKSSNRFPDCHSDNLKSKTCTEPRRSIKNLKWLGLSVIAFVLVVAGAMAEAQQPTKVPRIGYLTGGSLSSQSYRTEAFRQGLRDLGYVEGKNIVIEWRAWETNAGRRPALAAELVSLKVDVIVAVGPGDTRAVREATATIPIVTIQAGDPGIGFVASLARPGGNITGLSTLSPELSGKRLELLKEVVPKLSRVAVFGNSTSAGRAQDLKEIELAASAFGVKVQHVDILSPKDVETAFRAAGKGRAEAVLFHASDPFIASQRPQVAALAVKSRFPVMYRRPEDVEAGGLMSYGVNYLDLDRRAATYVDKILKGRTPADLPVEQPMKFEFIVNLKAANAIGLTIPQWTLMKADKVIQ